MKEFFLEGLNENQKKVCLSHDNLLVTACPGSGKTRTLIHKIGYYLDNSPSIKKIIAITYTNRAADEIIDRLEILGVDYSRVWVGTIHQFCLEFIINRFRMYDSVLSRGYKIIDERVSNSYIDEIAKSMNVKLSFDNRPNLRYDRKFTPLEQNESFRDILAEYRKLLRQKHEIDFEMILLRSYKLLNDNSFICELIKNSFELICIDEYQDTQDLQYAIIEKIYNSNNNKLEINFFGDPNQSIYETLGGYAKSLKEINEEFYDNSFHNMVLNGCYRSPQNIIDFYSNFMVEKYKIISVEGKENGIIKYNTNTSVSDLYIKVAECIKFCLKKGIKPFNICVLAPTWNLLFPFSRQLKSLLPNVPFDSPDITPIKKDPLNVFYNISYLSLTKPSIKKISTRKRISLDILNYLSQYGDINIEPIDLLNFINSNNYTCEKGTEFISYSIIRVLKFLNIDLNSNQTLKEEYNDFIGKIFERLNNDKFQLTDELSDFKNMFMDKAGVVINTIHGVKGEEYDVVISFGLLKSKIPSMFTPLELKDNVANRLLYVMASRCKKILIMISETGRKHYGEYDEPCSYLSDKFR